jgi:glycosyltransferase involved in cell wall biosynthesis
MQSATALANVSEEWRLPSKVRFYSPVETPAPRDLFDLLPRRFAKAIRYRWQRRSMRGPACGVYLDLSHLVRRILLAHPIDIVLFEHIEAMTLAPLVRRLSPHSVRVLDAHNIDHRLAEQGCRAKPADKRLKREALRLRRVETSLVSEVDAVIACSDEDRDELVAMNAGKIRGFTVPNGVDTGNKPFDNSPDKRLLGTLLFCGSLDYEPNVDGLLWFHHEIWPLVKISNPEIRLRVIGRGAKTSPWRHDLQSDQQIDLIGEVDDVGPHYKCASMSIVPLRMGSGTRLKILEAMAFGTPVVSTAIGAEGIKGTSGVHLELADNPESFAAAVSRLLHTEFAYEHCRSEARKLVENCYDWRVSGEKLKNALDNLG